MECVAPDLEKERRSSKLNLPELTRWSDGGLDLTEKRMKMS